MNPLELWGGAECTVNRVGDLFRDQLRETGHHQRADDLDRIAALGVTALRFPLLWERSLRRAPGGFDWRWADARLKRLRELGIRPIAGLVHHGSGPRSTNLLADDFAPGLAQYAASAARRYPWIRDWTPVNEPLTTARFSALYGHWYPHRRDERSFWLALINQIDATRLAMAEIRAVHPGARLIQTDDLGRTYSTVAVREQAAFDNVRRWMGWDLLCGRVVPGHDLWKRLTGFGFQARLEAIAAAPCPPDLIGINHYLTSDRFLDHRLQRYPAHLRGGNDRQAFVDTEAVRVLEPPPPGLRCAMAEAWERYGIPVALTEVHNGCTREEQMRWTIDAWHGAQQLRAAGVPVEAMTSWALFGNQGWNRLLTERGSYEPGCFDVSSGRPRATALADLLTTLAAGREPDHPALAEPGWWRRPIRLHHPMAPRPAPMGERARAPALSRGRPMPVLITGGTGTLGKAMAAACEHRGIAHVLTTRDELDLARPQDIDRALDRHRPWAVINTAGWVRVDDAEAEEQACRASNAVGAAQLATACEARGLPSAYFSSDLVFDGRAGRPYRENDRPAPLNAYGRTKVEAERAIGRLGGKHLIIRTAAFFSPQDPYNFAWHAVEALSRGTPFAAACDQIVTPTYVPDLTNAVLDLLIDGETGIWHLSNGQAVSWAEFGQMLAIRCGFDPGLVEAVPGAMLGWCAPRPASVPLDSRRGKLLPSLGEAIDRFARHRQACQKAGELAAA